ncbi:MAG: (d)CMP kinase [Ignavibacteria bacterium]
MSKKIIIAIDGPAGSGKSSLAKLIAKRLGYTYLDTGAMYRAVTYLALKNKVINDEDAVIALAENSCIELSFTDGRTEVVLNGENITGDIRSFEVNSNVSEVSKIAKVRYALVKKQREIGLNNNVIAEGRDTGTIVFPDADVKIFLVASLKERTVRRLKEFEEKGEPVSPEDIEGNLSKRDTIDSQREVGPLVKAEDAIEIDTSNISIEEEVKLVLEKAALAAGCKDVEELIFLSERK